MNDVTIEQSARVVLEVYTNIIIVAHNISINPILKHSTVCGMMHVGAPIAAPGRTDD